MQLALNTLKNWTWCSFSLTNITKVPQVSGVYCLGKNDAVTYIGSSNNMQNRLRQHYSTTDPCIKQATQFAIEPCANYKEREKQRLREYRMKHGRLPACNDLI